MHCVCGYEIKRVELPSDLASLSGRRFLMVHIESSSTHCYPDADNEADRGATAEVDTSYPEDEQSRARPPAVGAVKVPTDSGLDT